MVTHDLPYAFEICQRSLVLNQGEIVADDQTVNILRNEKLLLANRLELPKGFAI
jgi:cobalt/nickel transport system ATP-binding protein